MAYAYRVKISRHEVSDNVIRKLIPIIGFPMRGDSGPVPCTIHQKLQLQTI